MKTALILVLVASACAATVSSYAQTYQWKDRNGRTIISDTPPPASVKASQATGNTQATQNSTPVEKAVEAPKTVAEKDLEFKKRQQEAKDKAEKDAKEKTAAAEKQQNCERARRSVVALESNQPLATLDENGQRSVMDNNQREQELERARRIVAESCK